MSRRRERLSLAPQDWAEREAQRRESRVRRHGPFVRESPTLPLVDELEVPARQQEFYGLVVGVDPAVGRGQAVVGFDPAITYDHAVLEVGGSVDVESFTVSFTNHIAEAYGAYINGASARGPRTEALDRARALLLELLDDVQAEDFRATRSFVMKATVGGRPWHLRASEGKVNNIKAWSNDGRSETWCSYAPGLPDCDTLVAQLLTVRAGRADDLRAASVVSSWDDRQAGEAMVAGMRYSEPARGRPALVGHSVLMSQMMRRDLGRRFTTIVTDLS